LRRSNVTERFHAQARLDILSAMLGAGLVCAAPAASQTTLYVDQANPNCSDSGVRRGAHQLQLQL